jgi:signal-transduction protein with cAMP-binding, CBS, and nucleotidyltransferase domain
VSRQLRGLLWADATTSMREAAQQMSEAGQSCVLVRLRDGAVGIATDQDFRRLVARPDASLDAPVASIATTPVLSVPEDATVTEAFSRLDMERSGLTRS